MAARSRRPFSITIIGILTLIQATALGAFGFYMAPASSYLSSNMLFIPRVIEPDTFTMLQKVWGGFAIALGVASATVSFATLGGKRQAWISNVIVTGLAAVSVVAIHDIKYLPSGALFAAAGHIGNNTCEPVCSGRAVVFRQAAFACKAKIGIVTAWSGATIHWRRHSRCHRQNRKA